MALPNFLGPVASTTFPGFLRPPRPLPRPRQRRPGDRGRACLCPPRRVCSGPPPTARPQKPVPPPEPRNRQRPTSITIFVRMESAPDIWLDPGVPSTRVIMLCRRGAACQAFRWGVRGEGLRCEPALPLAQQARPRLTFWSPIFGPCQPVSAAANLSFSAVFFALSALAATRFWS